jgi:hypothetical protein
VIGLTAVPKSPYHRDDRLDRGEGLAGARAHSWVAPGSLELPVASPRRGVVRIVRTVRGCLPKLEPGGRHRGRLGAGVRPDVIGQGNNVRFGLSIQYFYPLSGNAGVPPGSPRDGPGPA